jgi:hypothetical protein
VARGKEVIWRRAVPIAGRPYLAGAAEEHSGPHRPWFWRGDRQGGGVLNDMLCHSYEAARYLLTAPGGARDSLTVTEVNAQIASLKWTRPEYAELLREQTGGAIDYGRAPAEDFARATVRLRTPEGLPVIVEATTSWGFVGPGLRLPANDGTPDDKRPAIEPLDERATLWRLALSRREMEAAARRSAAWLRRSRRRGQMRWPKYLFLYENWVDYMLEKIERSTGRRLEVTPRERRWPLIFGWRHFFALRRAGLISADSRAGRAQRPAG